MTKANHQSLNKFTFNLPNGRTNHFTSITTTIAVSYEVEPATKINGKG
jgi:hypothetical protein